ncbi:hypothetical protein [Helicobacter didelphidarum]|nr:hypothetical protein [Helicobacter didelphidarum]
MRNKTLKLISSIALCGVLVGCGQSVPQCDDKVVLEELDKIITEITEENGLGGEFLGHVKDGLLEQKLVDNAKKSKFEYSSFMLNNTDEKEKKIICKAKWSNPALIKLIKGLHYAMFVSLTPENEVTPEISEMLEAMQGLDPNVKTWFEYSAQYINDNKDLHVEMLTEEKDFFPKELQLQP